MSTTAYASIHIPTTPRRTCVRADARTLSCTYTQTHRHIHTSLDAPPHTRTHRLHAPTQPPTDTRTGTHTHTNTHRYTHLIHIHADTRCPTRSRQHRHQWIAVHNFFISKTVCSKSASADKTLLQSKSAWPFLFQQCVVIAQTCIHQTQRS